MGLFDKVKNLFTEEVEVEEKEEKKGKKEETIKKEVIQVEIPSPVKATRSEKHAEEVKEEPKIEEPKQPEPVKEEKKFPFFDDGDFESLNVEPVSLKKEKKPYHKEVYNPPKEEKKVFRPSPIISPVYGILDKDYPKEEMRRSPEKSYKHKEASVDEIRNKAYGTLESDIETTLFGKKRVLFEENDNKNQSEQPKDEIISTDDEYDSNIIGEKPRHGNTETVKAEGKDELTDLINAEMDKEVPETPKKTPRKISDSELFSLIDSMYEKGDKK